MIIAVHVSYQFNLNKIASSKVIWEQRQTHKSSQPNMAGSRQRQLQITVFDSWRILFLGNTVSEYLCVEKLWAMQRGMFLKCIYQA